MLARISLLSLVLFAWINPPPCRAQAIRSLAGHRGAVTAVAVRPDGKWMASASFDHTLKVWDVARGKSLLTCVGHVDKVTALAWSSDGKLIASASLDRSIRLWNPVNGKRRMRLLSGEPLHPGRLPSVPTASVCSVPGRAALSRWWT